MEHLSNSSAMSDNSVVTQIKVNHSKTTAWEMYFSLNNKVKISFLKYHH